ncbi:hypothetical protein [Pseudonocardia pini]|uniref:hypothetical protein n=1 Tax=Pseudonocardia pini TaxID=2758030 RepID=UPI0015F01FD3|nr:hypothetical protein [Pseudonocardia pini]
MTLTVLLSVLVLIAVLAPRYGADSRSMRDAPHYTATPWGDLKAAWWRFRYALERPARQTRETSASR